MNIQCRRLTDLSLSLAREYHKRIAVLIRYKPSHDRNHYLIRVLLYIETKIIKRYEL